jgi:hypothetical protein
MNETHHQATREELTAQADSGEAPSLPVWHDICSLCAVRSRTFGRVPTWRHT